MTKKIFGKKARALAVVLVAAVLLVVTLVQPVAQAATYDASYVKEYTGDLKVNYQDFLDTSVMQKLPDTIKADDEISVIIALNEQNLMDAYEATDKAMSFTQFALESEEAAEIIGKRDSRKAQILAALDEAGVAYTAGEEYSAALTGFELVIQAKDFDVTCKSLGEGAGIIVGEEYKPAETKLVENTVNVYETGILMLPAKTWVRAQASSSARSIRSPKRNWWKTRSMFMTPVFLRVKVPVMMAAEWLLPSWIRDWMPSILPFLLDR